MENIKYEDITIADEHLNGQDYDRCKNALWSIHNIFNKIKNNSTPQCESANIFALHIISSLASFKDENMDSIVFSFPESAIKIRYADTVKKDLEQNGFVFSDYVFADGEKPKKNPNLNKVQQFTFSYNGEDFKDVIFGLKFLRDICAKYPQGKDFGIYGKGASIFFDNGDISIAFKNANVIDKEREFNQNKKDNMKNMKDMLQEERFNIISDDDKAFIIAFDKEMEKLGYDYGGDIGTGHGWGIYQIIYGKTDTKSRPIATRIYVKKDGSILLRLFLNKIDTHRKYIENAAAFIKDVFTNDKEICTRCAIKDDGTCGYNSFKPYTIDGREIVKCNGKAFVFRGPSLEKLPDYVDLLSKFYKKKK